MSADDPEYVRAISEAAQAEAAAFRARIAELLACIENLNAERMYLYERLAELDPTYAASKAVAERVGAAFSEKEPS